MNKLGFTTRQNRWRAEVFYDDLTIDGEFLDVILSSLDTANHSDIGINELISATDLNDKTETELLWHYLGQLQENNRGFVPVLVCPDDVDLTCTVIVTEQFVKDNQVHWLRFGLLLGDFEQQNENDIQWFINSPHFIFDKQNFIDVFGFFLEETKAYWLNYGDKINIKIPADPPKEDWELIVDSWYD